MSISGENRNVMIGFSAAVICGTVAAFQQVEVPLLELSPFLLNIFLQPCRVNLRGTGRHVAALKSQIIIVSLLRSRSSEFFLLLRLQQVQLLATVYKIKWDRF